MLSKLLTFSDSKTAALFSKEVKYVRRHVRPEDLIKRACPIPLSQVVIHQSDWFQAILKKTVQDGNGRHCT